MIHPALLNFGSFHPHPAPPPSKGEGFSGFGMLSNFGGPCRDRTYDLLIKSQLLYQLS